MPHQYSTAYHEVITALSPPEHPFILLKIEHSLADPLRLINDTQDLVFQGERYIAVGFRCVWVDDVEGQLPKATLQIDNTTNLFSRLFEQTAGMRGMKVRMIEALRSNPSVIERQIQLDVDTVSMNTEVVQLGLGFEDTLNKSAINLTYRPPTTTGARGFPGLF
jgi:hypothetical protein